MTLKAIDFEALMACCKHKEDTECSEEDNYSCQCENEECPIWSELKSAEIEN